MRLSVGFTAVVVMILLSLGPARNVIGGEAPAESITLTLDVTRKFQTWAGWGVTLPMLGCPVEQWAQDPTRATYDAAPVTEDWSHEAVARLLDELVFDLGLTHFRLEIGPQVEIENDNDDPNVSNEDAFRFKWQDVIIERLCLPLRERVIAREQKPVFSVAFGLTLSLVKPFLLQPAEYAEMAEVFCRHLRDKHGIQADYWAVISQPGFQGRPGDTRQVAALAAATGARLAKAGFATRISAPETADPAHVSEYALALRDLAGPQGTWGRIAYQLRRGADDVSARRAIRILAQEHSLPAAQTGWAGSSALDLIRAIHFCLTEAEVTSWEVGEFATLYQPDAARVEFEKTSTAWYLRQYSRYIPPGSVRVALGSPSEEIRAVAFLSPRDRVIIVLANLGSTERMARLVGLPPATYQGTSTAPGAPGRPLAATEIAEGMTLDLKLPAQSVTTYTAEPPAAPPPALPTVSRSAPRSSSPPPSPATSIPPRTAPPTRQPAAKSPASKSASPTQPSQATPKATQYTDPPTQRSRDDRVVIARGTVTGTVTAKGSNWIEVRSPSGKVNRYIPEWHGGASGGPDRQTVNAIARLKTGDQVIIDWYVNDHLRISRIQPAR